MIRMYCTSCDNTGQFDPENPDEGNEFAIWAVHNVLLKSAGNGENKVKAIAMEPVEDPMEALMDPSKRKVCRKCNSNNVEVIVEPDVIKERKESVALDAMEMEMEDETRTDPEPQLRVNGHRVQTESNDKKVPNIKLNINIKKG